MVKGFNLLHSTLHVFEYKTQIVCLWICVYKHMRACINEYVYMYVEVQSSHRAYKPIHALFEA